MSTSFAGGVPACQRPSVHQPPRVPSPIDSSWLATMCGASQADQVLWMKCGHHWSARFFTQETCPSFRWACRTLPPPIGVVSPCESQKAVIFSLFPSYWDVPRQVYATHTLPLPWFHEHLEGPPIHPCFMTNTWNVPVQETSSAFMIWSLQQEGKWGNKRWLGQEVWEVNFKSDVNS